MINKNFFNNSKRNKKYEKKIYYLNFKLKQCLRCDGSVKSLLDSTDPSDDDDDDCCGNNEEYGKNFLINVLKNKVVRFKIVQ